MNPQGCSQEKSAVLLEEELQGIAGQWNADKLLRTAEKLERWIAQMRFKADALYGNAARNSPEQLN